jgi:hydroxymethylbilane synthase
VAGVDIRGNIDTRLRKFREHRDWNGLVLAAAGLERLGPDVAGLTLVPLPPEQMLPAPGQGALAVQVRGADAETLKMVAQLDDGPTRQAVTAERAFLSALGGGCEWPVGALAETSGNRLTLRGIYWHETETAPRRGQIEGLDSDAAVLGCELAARLLS